MFVDKYLPKHGIGAELGVFKGQFTPVLLQYSDAVKLHLVDPWYLVTPHYHWGGGNPSTIDAMTGILKRWRREIEAGSVLLHVGDDRNILQSFPDHYFDWVYVDTTHQYDHTADELHILRHKVKPAGVIAGDDWYPNASHKHHGVFTAVNEFCALQGYSLIYSNADNRQWAIKRGREERC